MAWPDVERRLASGALAVLPVGAAANADGPRLFMGADCLQAKWLASS